MNTRVKLLGKKQIKTIFKLLRKTVKLLGKIYPPIPSPPPPPPPRFGTPGWNKYVNELEQKLNERVLRPVPVPSSKKDIDVLANKVHSVITKSYEAACPMRKSLCKKDNIW